MPALPRALNLKADRRGMWSKGLMIPLQLSPEELPLVVKVHQLTTLAHPHHRQQCPTEEGGVDADQRIDDCAMGLTEAKE